MEIYGNFNIEILHDILEEDIYQSSTTHKTYRDYQNSISIHDLPLPHHTDHQLVLLHLSYLACDIVKKP
ncbi:hypothetical protein J6590_099588, partial [Homalodisca vitripennis]